nr:hypothetical protein [Tanacetum cinerariifolium]
MAPLIFADTHNMVAFLSKSDATEATIKKVNDVVQLRTLIDEKKVVVTVDVIRRDLHLDDADGCLSAKRTAWNEFSCSMASALICLATDDLSSYNTRYTSPALTQKVFANMRRVGKGFLGVETPLFASMMVPPQQAAEEEVPNAPTPPSPTNAPSPPPQDPTLTPHVTPHASLQQEQPTITFESSMSLLNSLLETYAIMSQKKLEKKRRSKSSWLKRLRKVGISQRVESSNDTIVGRGGKIKAIDADEDITLVDMEKDENVVDMDAELQGRIDQDVSAPTKDVSAAEPTVFNDEEMAQRLYDEEVEKDAAREKQKKDDLERAKVLQQQYDDKEENINWSVVVDQVQERNLDNIRKYQSLKKKHVSIAQAKKNMIIYLKNMAGYKMEHFIGMTYDKIRPIFEREYKKVQTLFKPDKDVEKPQKKKVAKETLLQESFKKLKAVEVKYPIIDWEIHSEGSRTYWKIIRVGGITEAYQSFEDMLKGFDREDLVALWSLVKEKFSTAVPSVDKEKALWKLHTNGGVHQVSSTTRRHDMFMLIDKDYPLSNAIMTLMLSAKLQVEEDNKMARDLVLKIFMEANKPKSRSLDTSSK